ncbi:MAG: flavin reductase protein [uncultured bacterium]|nr:MAG: flavin reductase protein [uncultured bacterium]
MNKLDLGVLCQIQYGMFIVTSYFGEKINGQISTVVFQVTCQPAQVVTCLHKDNLTHQFVTTSGSFGVSILSQEADLKFIGQFGFRTGRDFDKFTNVNYKKLSTGSPLVLDHAVGLLDLKVIKYIDVGTHTLFIGELLASEKLNDKTPMTYDYYHNAVKGKTQKNAPTFQTCVTGGHNENKTIGTC